MDMVTKIAGRKIPFGDPSMGSGFELPVTTCHYINMINSRGIWFQDDPLSYSVPALMLQLSLITSLTRFIHLLLKPVGQPLIISQILGGLILGPSVLGQNSAFSTKLFPIKGRVVLDTLSIFGFMLFIFLIGIKLDPGMVFRSGKKALAIGILGFIVPIGLASFAVLLINQFMSLDEEVKKMLPFVVAIQSMTAFPVIACFLEELKILNSEIGRLASSSSFICDLCHWSLFSLYFAAKLAKDKSLKVTIGSLLSGGLFIVVIVFGLRPAALWAVRQTPEGKPVKEIYIFSVLVALMACGIVGETIGLTAVVASMVLGLAIPDGPPLGAALVEKLECFVSVLLMPTFFIVCGLQTDVFCIQKLKNVGVIMLIVLIVFTGKMMGTLLIPLFFRMPFRDALSLALIMNSKGIVELALLNDFKKKEVLTDECYAILLISVVVLTGVISPLVKLLYDPSKRFLAYKRRTILHNRPNDELRILACVHSPDNVRTLINLIQVSNPAKESQIVLVVLHLVKLMGRASSILVAHRQRDKPSPNPSQSERIFNAFKKLEQHFCGLVVLHCFKAVSPYVTMHNDVCSLALEKRSTLVILPFHKQWMFGERIESTYAFRHLNKNVLDKAPCSIGILIDRGTEKKSRYVIAEPSIYRVAVLFFGGPDDREALAYGQRMSKNENVTLTLIEFKVNYSCDTTNGGSARSRMLDGEVLGNFRLNTLHQSERVSSHEEVVTSGTSVADAITSAVNHYDLIMVGRRHAESQIMVQIKKWNERGELGAPGEILASSDFKGGASVLVVQQQSKLWGLQDPEESTHLRRIDL